MNISKKATKESILAELDGMIIDNYNGTINSEKWDIIWAEWANELVDYMENFIGYGEDLNAWLDSTKIHQVFDYWPTERPDTNKNKAIWKGSNDLAWVLAEYIKDSLFS